MFSPVSNSFLKTIKNPAEGTRPAAAMGTAVTPGTNAYGSYVQLINGGTAWAATDGDAYEIHVNVNHVNVSAAAHASAVTIGLDLAGGTSYTDKIVDLVAGPACDYAGQNAGAGVWFCFPLRIPNGASVGVKATRSVGTTAFNVMCHLKCKPTHPELIRCGSFVRTFGATGSGSPNGTAITCGTAAEGAFTASLGTLAEDLWYWEFGVGADSSLISANTTLIDVAVGDGSNKRLVIDDAEIYSQTIESLCKPRYSGAYSQARAGDLVYMRGQVGTGNAPTNFTGAVYGVGG